jgi:hypothetical protein
MKRTVQSLFVAILIPSAVSLFAAPPGAIPSPKAQKEALAPEGVRPGGFRPAMMRRFGGGRDSMTSGPVANIRQLMSNELKNVPLLGDKIRDLMQIHQERMVLQRQRQQIAMSSEEPTDEVLKRFHELLRREDQLTSKVQALTGDLARDAEKIRKQVLRRQQEIDSQIAQLREVRPDSKEPAATGDIRNLARAKRLYDFVLELLNSLESEQNSQEWPSKLMRGLWAQDEIDSHVAEQARRQLQQIQHDQEDLRRRIEQIDERLQDLTELLDAAAAQRRWRERREPRESEGRPPQRPSKPSPAPAKPPDAR